MEIAMELFRSIRAIADAFISADGKCVD